MKYLVIVLVLITIKTYSNSSESINIIYKTKSKIIDTGDSIIPPQSQGETHLIAYYPFNGNANDSSGNFYNGTNNGATLTTDRFGNTNNAYSFNGTSSYISVPDNNDFKNIKTISLWFNNTVDGSDTYSKIMVVKNSNYYPGISYWPLGHEVRFWENVSGSAIELRSDSNITYFQKGTWHHTAFVLDGDSAKLYVDGVLVDSDSLTYNPFNNTNELKIGGGTSGRYFTGKLDDIRIYNQALTTSEIQQLYGNDTTTMSGTYTIGQNGTEDYLTINEAITDLKTFGIDSAVIFNISPGTYKEKLYIPYIQGSSKQNTICFQSSTNDSIDVVIADTMDYFSNYALVHLDSGLNIQFKHITFSGYYGGSYTYKDVIKLSKNSENIVFESNIIKLEFQQYDNGILFRLDTIFSNIQIINNKFINGNRGIFSEIGSNKTSSNINISSNKFINQKSQTIWLNYTDSIYINNNYFSYSNFNSLGDGALLMYCDSTIQITNNIVLRNCDENFRAFSLQKCSGKVIERILFANNFISIKAKNDGNRGLGGNQIENINIYNNTIHLQGDSLSNSVCLVCHASNMDIINNNLINTVHSLVYSSGTSIGSNHNIDYNNLYTNGNSLVYYDNVYQNLTQYQTYSSNEQNSISVFPDFLSDSSYIYQNSLLNGSGMPLSLISADIEGKPRDANFPDIGAYESICLPPDTAIFNNITEAEANVNWTNNGIADYWQLEYDISGFSQGSGILIDSLAQTNYDLNMLTIATSYDVYLRSIFGIDTSIWSGPFTFTTSSTCNPIAGAYTIGNDSADFMDINMAINKLMNCGISGPVVFNIKSGTYNEQITIPEISGTSNTNTITFQSATADSTDVIIQYNATGTADNFVISGDQVKHLRFNYISFTSLSQSYSNILKLNSYCQNIQFSNCVFNSASTITNNSTNGAITNINGDYINDIKFENNLFEGGNYGIFMNGNIYNRSKRLIVKNNSFNNTAYYGIYVQRVDSVLFDQNTIISKDASWGFEGIYYSYFEGQSKISRNQIINRATANFYAILINNKSTVHSGELEISNNFITSTRTVQYYTGGLMINNSAFLNIYYNTFRIKGANSNNSYAMKVETSNGINLKNNIFLNEGQGYAYYIDSISYIQSSTNNCLFSFGNTLAYIQGSFSNLSVLKNSTALENSSLQLDPYFSNPTDYNPKNYYLNGSATPLGSVAEDIDGTSRDVLNPDIGADEFDLITNDLSVLSLNTENLCEGNKNIILNLHNNGANTISSFLINYSINGALKSPQLFNTFINSGDSATVIIKNAFNAISSNSYNIKAYISIVNSVYDSNNFNDTIEANNLIYHALPIVSIYNISPSYCNNSPSVTLNGSPNGGIFKVNNSIDSIFNPGLNLGANIITYEYTNSNSCSNYDTVSTIVNQDYSFEDSISICNNSSYLWNGQLISSAGTYYDSLISIDACDSVYKLVLNINPTNFYQESAEICDGNSYSWHGNTYNSAGIYYDSLTSVNGCDSVFELNLIINPTYFYQESASICEGEAYSWHGNIYTSTGIYYDSLLTSVGCDSVYELTLTVNNKPMVLITTPINNVCKGDNSFQIISYPSGGTFTGTTLGSTFDPSLESAGNKQIVYSYTDVNSCANSDTINITINPLPVVSHSVLIDVCENTSLVSLTGGTPSGGSYIGNNVSTSNSTFYPQAAGPGNHQIIYEYSDVNGCTNSDTIYQKVNTVPDASFSIPATACVNDTIFTSFSGSAGANAVFNWNFGTANLLAGVNAGPYELSYDTSGLKQISLNITDSGCTSTLYSNYVNILTGFAMITSVGTPFACYGDSVTLFANTGIGYTYQWFDSLGAMVDDTNSYIKVGNSGDYYCMISSPNNCTSKSNTISVEIHDEINAEFTIPPFACLNDTVLINYNGTASALASYIWDFDGGNIVSGAAQGPYQVSWDNDTTKVISLQIIESNCASEIIEKLIQIQSPPANITAFGNTSFCQGDSVTLLANTGNFSYQWLKNQQIISNANNPFISIKNSGNYSVIITDNSNYCSKTSDGISIIANTNNFNLDFSANPISFNIPPFITNFNNLTANNSDFYWTWNFGDGNTSTQNSPSHTYAFDGDYTVSLIGQNIQTGCVDTLIKTDYISCSGGSPNPCSIKASIISSMGTTKCINDSMLLISGETDPTYSYQWIKDGVIIQSANDSIFYAKQSGAYQLMISNNICTEFSNPFQVNNFPNVKPSIQNNGSLTPCSNDSMELFVSNYYTSYLWNTGDSTSNIFVKNSGNYIVTAFDINGCSASSNPFVVNASYLQPPDICIVGVDTMNNNRIIWEKSLTQPIDSFKVYRESTSAGIYDLIDSKSFNEIALSLDTASNSSIRSYNYQITALDTCGMESPPSYIHKTIHLSINAGLNGAWNLIWNHYEGFSFGTYNIYRGTSPNNLSLLTSLPSSINSYTDISPPTGTIYYQIEIVKASGCYPDSVFTKANTNYNSSRSNMADNGSIAPIYLNADFNADLQTGQWPFKVQFSDLSTGSPDSWYWNFGDGNYSIEQNPNHTYNNTGMYSVSLVACNYNLCDTMVKSNLIDVKPNGVINIFRTINAEIYPNPSNGIFTLAIHEKINQKANLIIYNSLGQIAYQSNLNLFNNLHHKLDLSTQAKGVYFVHLSTDNGVVYREKVVVQ